MKQSASSLAPKMIAGTGLIGCCSLLMLALPRLLASGYNLYPETVYHQTQGETPASVYESGILNLNRALSWYQSADYWQTQAFFYLKLLNTQSIQEFQQKHFLLENAQTAINQGLGLSPVDPFGWFQLAKVNKLLKTPAPRIINALRLSFYAERVEPELVMTRLAFSYDYYADFNQDMQQQWQNQLLTAWTVTPNELIKFVAQHPETKELALQALAYSTDDAKKFIHDLEITVKKPL